MYRVVTKYRDRRNCWIVEAGPWHVSRDDAEDWSDMLRNQGYLVEIENAHGAITDETGNDALRDALSSMA